MATFDYSPFVNAATQLISQFGSSCSLTRKPAGTYDPASSQATVTSATQTITAVAFPYEDKLIDGTTIQTGDQQVFVSPSGVTDDPKPNDVLLYGGIRYTVIRVKAYKPGETAVLYELQVRK